MDLQLGNLPQVYLLALFRVLAILLPIMIYGRAMVSAKVMVIIGVMITIVMVPVVPPSWVQAAVAIRTVPDLVLAIMSEVLLGYAIGLILNIFLSICMVGGTIAQWGSSLMMAETLDPASGVSNVILAEIIQSVFIILFLISNAHLLVLKMLAASFSVVPPSLEWLNAGVMEHLISQGEVMFKWGLRLGLPVMGSILIVDVALGLVARMAPDFDILFLSFPVRLIVGVTALALTLRQGAGFFNHVIEMATQAFARILI